MSPEDKIAQDTKHKLDTVYKQSDDKNLVQYYEQLYLDYVKLLNRTKKMMKINDRQNLSILIDNESLANDKNEIIHHSKQRIMNSISSNREQIGTYSNKMSSYIDTIVSLKDKVKLIENENNKLTNTLKDMLKKSKQDDIKVKKLDEQIEQLQAKINIVSGDISQYKEMLEQEIQKTRKNKKFLIAGILGVDNYDKLKSKIVEFTEEDKFISAMTKYLQNSLNKSYDVVYFQAGMFLMIVRNIPINTTVKKFQEIGRKKIIQGVSITFSGYFTHLTQDDNADSISERYFESYHDMILNNQPNTVLEV
jgi:chromosome segregation ATPase